MVLAMLLLGTASQATEGAPSLVILEPMDGERLLDPSVTVMGTASGSSTTWSQGGRADFEAGSKVNVTVTPAGLVQLSNRFSDDYNDNSLDLKKWTKTNAGDIDAHEKDGTLHLEGRCSTGGTWNSRVWLMSTGTVCKYVQVTMVSIFGTGVGYVSGIFLYDDDRNYAGIGAQYEPDVYGPGLHIIISAHINGVQRYYTHGSTDNSTHTYKVVYKSGAATLYQDDNEIESIGLSLTNPKALYTCGARQRGDRIEAIYDDLITGYEDGSLTSTVKDTRCSPPIIESVDWNATTPGTTDVELDMRSSDSLDMHSATTWTLLVPRQQNGFPPAHRYIQYRARLMSGDGTVTPELRNVSFQYLAAIASIDVRLDGSSTWCMATGTERWSITLMLPERAVTIWVRATDSAGDVKISSIRVLVDTAPPSGTVLINGGDAFTASENVMVALAVSDDDVVDMQLGNGPDLSGATWVPYATSRAWRLPSGDGMKTVHARFRDSRGLLSDVVSDSIVLDTQPPAGSITINHGVMYTNSTRVVLQLPATDLSGVADVMVGERPQFDNAAWTAYRPSMAFVLSEGDGKKTVYARFRDQLGHVSTVVDTSIILDTRPPLLFITINDGAAFTNERQVALRLEALEEGSVQSMQLSEDPFFTGVPTEPFKKEVGWLLSAADGWKFVYGRAWDSMGNLGPVTWDSIILDTTPPVLDLAINEGAAFTNSTSIMLTIGTLEENGIDEVLISEEAILGDAAWSAFGTPLGFMLTGGDGMRNVFARATDLAGNLGPIATDSITLDTVPPSLVITLNDGATSTSSRELEVRLSATDSSGVDLMRLAEDSLLTVAGTVQFESRTNWTLSPGDGERSVQGAVRDRAGNWGPTATDTIVLDTTPPYSSILATSPSGGSIEAKVSWNAIDVFSEVRSYDVQYRDGKGEWMDWQTSTCSTSAIFLGERGHSYDLRARAVDELGNVEPFPEVEARFAHVTIPSLPKFHLGFSLLWLIVVILTALAVALGYYSWDKRKRS